MNIKLLKSSGGYEGTLLNETLVLETKLQKSQYSGINQVRYFIYDVEKNIREEIIPKMKKHNFVRIMNCSYQKNYIFFSNINSLGKGKLQVNLMRYNFMDKKCEVIYSFTDNKVNIHPDKKRVRIFVLNDTHLIIQNELYKTTKHTGITGFFDFELFLYNIKEKEMLEIVDEEFKINGINSIIPISETHSAIKTGYSLLENNLYKKISEEESCVENLNIVNIQQLISDMQLMNPNNLFEPIIQTHYFSTIPYFIVEGDYLVYSVVNFEAKEEEINFYNYVTKENINCISQNITSVNDLAKPYIIDNMPYIKIINEAGTEYYNISKGKVDIKFEPDVVVNDFVNDIFVASKSVKKHLGKEKPYIMIYKHPGEILLHEEKAEYVGSISSDNNNIIVFVK